MWCGGVVEEVFGAFGDLPQDLRCLGPCVVWEVVVKSGCCFNCVGDVGKVWKQGTVLGETVSEYGYLAVGAILGLVRSQTLLLLLSNPG